MLVQVRSCQRQVRLNQARSGQIRSYEAESCHVSVLDYTKCPRTHDKYHTHLSSIISEAFTVGINTWSFSGLEPCKTQFTRFQPRKRSCITVNVENVYHVSQKFSVILSSVPIVRFHVASELLTAEKILSKMFADSAQVVSNRQQLPQILKIFQEISHCHWHCQFEQISWLHLWCEPLRMFLHDHFHGFRFLTQKQNFRTQAPRVLKTTVSLFWAWMNENYCNSHF